MMETIDDILREMRKDIPRVVDAKVILRNYADRIEAAHGREVVVSKTDTTTKESLAVANGAKMRKAFEQVVYIVKMFDDIDEVRRRVKMVNADLSAEGGAE